MRVLPAAVGHSLALSANENLQDQFVQKLHAQVAEMDKKKQSLEARLQTLKLSMHSAIEAEQAGAAKELQRAKRQWVAEEKVRSLGLSCARHVRAHGRVFANIANRRRS